MIIDYKIIGQRIAKHRKANRITQETLAEYLDVSTAFVSKIERGRTHLNLERLVQICHFLNISPAELLNDSDFSSDSYMNPEFSALLEQCPNELLPVIKSIIEDLIKHYPQK